MAKYPRSPLAPRRFPAMPAIAGVALGAAAAGVRYRGRPDLLLASLAPGTTVAGLLTTNKLPGWPVPWCARVLKGGLARGLVVNAGNANVFTGRAGREAVTATAKAAADVLGCEPGEVLIASTGVIGERFDAAKLLGVLPRLHRRLKPTAWRAAAEAISTTDTFFKCASRTARIDGATVTINGIAKGSGMIAPDLATMLAFLFTDAAIPAPVLRRLLTAGARQSFNMITVDGETSTSDTVLAFATGRGARHSAIASAADPGLDDFRRALFECMADLARQIVCDGEGAGRFVAITVRNAATAAAARRIAMTVANSPLVKTAIAGGDPNWGRIVAAVGRSGERADRDRLNIEIGGIRVAEKGAVATAYREAALKPYMQGREIEIVIDVGVGRGRASAWTCDLTHGYIDINADYRS